MSVVSGDDETRAVFEQHESAVRSYCRDFPMVVERASGHHVWDSDGRRWIDLLAGAGALNYGHNPPSIVARVTDYLASGGPVQSLDLHTTAKAEFVERFVADVLQPRGMDHVLQFPGPAGTIAVEAALKLARKVTGRTNVVAFTGGFHGASLGSLPATSNSLLRGGAGVPLGGVTVLPYDGRLGAVDTSAVLAEMLAPGSGIDPPAAILLESVQGEGGLNVASPRWLAEVRRIADETGALLVLDDVQAGCGRTGTFLSTDHVPGFEPDIVCLSKSISGMGLPMGLVLVRREYDRWEPGEHNGTFRGHNLAFVGATAALDLWQDADLARHLPRLGRAIRDDLTEMTELANATAGGPVVEVAGRGTMSGLRFADAEDAERVRAGLFSAGVIAETSGLGRVIKFFPPLTMPVPAWRDVSGTIGTVLTDTLVPRIVPTPMPARAARIRGATPCTTCPPTCPSSPAACGTW